MQTYQEAPSMNLRQMEKMGGDIRDFLGVTGARWLPIAKIIEHILPEKYGDAYCFRVLTRAEMGDNHGYADLDDGELVLREDVYDGMLANVGRDRMTATHEMCHLYLHDRARLYRRMSPEPPPPWRDPEWQAKCLAGVIMMPAPMIKGCVSIRQIVTEFGVSEPAARHRVRQLGESLP